MRDSVITWCLLEMYEVKAQLTAAHSPPSPAPSCGAMVDEQTGYTVEMYGVRCDHLIIYHLALPCVAAFWSFHLAPPSNFAIWFYSPSAPSHSTMWFIHVILPFGPTISFYHPILPSGPTISIYHLIPLSALAIWSYHFIWPSHSTTCLHHLTWFHHFTSKPCPFRIQISMTLTTRCLIVLLSSHHPSFCVASKYIKGDQTKW